MTDSTNTIREFYDEFAGEQYLREIRRFGLRYDEMVENVLDLVKIANPKTVIDIGCGVGNIDESILEALPDSTVTGIDISEEMVKVSRENNSRYSERSAFSTQNALEFNPSCKFDLVLSNLAIHNLKNDEKRVLICKIKSWLNPDGTFVWGDFMTWENKQVEEYCMQKRKQAILATGADPGFVEQVLEKESKDPRITINEAIELLREIGFTNVSVHWVFTFLAVIHCKNGRQQ